MSSLQGPYYALYIGTFRTITSNWSESKNLSVMLKTIRNPVAPPDSVLSKFNLTYPTYIMDELSALLGNMVEGETGLDIGDAVHQLRAD